MDDNVDERLLEIPYERLSPEALQGVLEEYATRGGYECTLSLTKRVQILREKLVQRRLKILFDRIEQNINIVKADGKQ